MLRVGLITTGAFGRDVGRIIQDCPDALQITAVGSADHGWQWPEQPLDAFVAVTWRPSDALCERVDAHAFAAGLPWLPVCLEHPFLSVGPWVLPPDGPCFRCVRTRLSQHSPPGSVSDVARRAYDADQACGPLGHLPTHVRLTGGLIIAALAGLAAAPRPSSPDAWLDDKRLRMVRYHMGNGRFSSSQVIPCDGCPRCDQPGPRALRQRRVAAALAALTTELATGTSGGAAR